jgi:type IV secretory pathway TrbF-like protein
MWRAVPSGPIIVRHHWLMVYDFVTDKGALALYDYARANDPFAKIGQIQASVDVSSVIRASAPSTVSTRPASKSCSEISISSRR